MSCVDENKRLKALLARTEQELKARNRQLSEAVWELKKIDATGDRSGVGDALFFIGGIMKTRDDASAMLVNLASSLVGVTEVGGDNKGPEVEAFQKAVDGRASGEPWCMAFLMYCIIQVEAETGLLSQVFRSESVKQVWDNSPGDHKSQLPEVGSLMIWQYGETGLGHAGLVRSFTRDIVSTIEGNTGPQDKTIEREGDGVYFKTRPTHSVGRMNLIGYLKIF